MTTTANNTNYSVVRGIRRSFDPYGCVSSKVVGRERPISYGDRLFARLVMHGTTVMEFMISSVSDLTELWGELRLRCRGMRGLARLYLRNASRGWSMERRLMLYPDRNVRTETSHSREISAAFRGKATQLSFPWEL